MNHTPDDSLDLSSIPCPANAARAIMRLEGMDPGQILEIIIDDGEPAANVPAALEQEGYVIRSKEPINGRWRLLVERT